MNNCLFCKIIKGDIPSYTIYEDELCKVFLDVNPLTNGHALLIPKVHYDNVLDADLEFITHAFSVIKEKISPLLKEKLNCNSISISMIGELVNHYHIHIIPRYENDGFDFHSNKETVKDVEETFKIILKQ